MKVSYVSDLHLDFWVAHNSNNEKWQTRTNVFINKLIATDEGKKEVICIAGDLGHYNQQSLWALETFASHYEQVIFTYGNHDMYLISNTQQQKYDNNSNNRIKELYEGVSFIPNVQPLFSGETFIHGEITFAGLPLFYPLKTIEQQEFFIFGSNDSVYIKGVKINDEHDKQQLQYGKLREQNVDVMITHFPVISIDSHFKYNSTTCYLTPVKSFYARKWIFGHSHEQNVYEKSYGTFFINALGYPHEKLELNIKSFEIVKEVAARGN